MGKEKKALCKWDKESIKDKIDEIKTIVKEPGFVCKRCARVANDKEYLCKPEKL